MGIMVFHMGGGGGGGLANCSFDIIMEGGAFLIDFPAFEERVPLNFNLGKCYTWRCI